MSYLKFAKIFWGFDPPFTSLNTALINHMAGVQNVTTPRAWSADLHNLSRNASRNNDLRVKLFHVTTAHYAMI